METTGLRFWNVCFTVSREVKVFYRYANVLPTYACEHIGMQMLCQMYAMYVNVMICEYLVSGDTQLANEFASFVLVWRTLRMPRVPNY